MTSTPSGQATPSGSAASRSRIRMASPAIRTPTCCPTPSPTPFSARIAEGDIGAHFPPSDPQWKGAASSIFLARACELVRERGGAIANVDATIICEAPKIGPHRERDSRKPRGDMGVEIGRVAIKATTTERLGFTGRQEGMAALAIATVRLP